MALGRIKVPHTLLEALITEAGHVFHYYEMRVCEGRLRFLLFGYVLPCCLGELFLAIHTPNLFLFHYAFLLRGTQLGYSACLKGSAIKCAVAFVLNSYYESLGMLSP